jgi:hypothetical protein
MALFGAPQVRADHVERSVHAALGIVERLARVNVLLQADGIPRCGSASESTPGRS